MNREEFIKQYTEQEAVVAERQLALDKEKDRLTEIENEYYASLPWKVGDKIRIQQSDDKAPFTGYIIEVATFHPGLGNIFLRVGENMKDWGRRFFGVQPEQVEILEKRS